MANESALNVYWNDVPLIHQDGVILGYRLQLQKEEGGPVLWTDVGADVHGYIVSDLLIFQNYSVQILAFTIKGDGPLSEKVYQMTDESGELNSLELKRKRFNFDKTSQHTEDKRKTKRIRLMIDVAKYEIAKAGSLENCSGLFYNR